MSSTPVHMTRTVFVPAPPPSDQLSTPTHRTPSILTSQLKQALGERERGGKGVKNSEPDWKNRKTTIWKGWVIKGSSLATEQMKFQDQLISKLAYARQWL